MTMREIARQCDIPESTLRVWRDEFEAFLPAEGSGKRRRYPEATQEKLRQLTAWKKVGMSTEQIRAELSRRATPLARAQKKTQESQQEELLALLRTQSGELAALRAEVAALRQQLGARVRPLPFEMP